MKKKPDRVESLTEMPTGRNVHDLGGLPGGHIDTHEHTPTLTERRIDAMMIILRDEKRRFWTTDENRRTIETMLPSLYEGTEYYEKWVLSMRSMLIEKGVLNEAEIAAKLAEVKARAHTPKPAKPATDKAKPKKTTATAAKGKR